MSDRMEHVDESQAPAETLKGGGLHGRPRWHRRIDFALLAIVGLFALSQAVLWPLWTPWGDAIKYMITYSQALVVILLGLAWWFLFSPFSRKLVLRTGLPVVLLLSGWAASIRGIEFSGDMAITPSYRWERRQADVVREHRESYREPVTVLSAVPRPQPEDMPAYRGVQRDGVVVGPALLQDWESSPPEELWRQPCGGGYSSFAVVGPLAVTLEQRDADEVVVCYESATGGELWEHRYPAHFQEAMGGPGPRSTPTIHDDAVYTFGGFSDLFCLDLLTGRPRWHVNVLQQFQLPNTHWAMASSPLVHEGKVIVNIGGMSGNGLVAYELGDGTPAWYSEGLPEPDRTLSRFRTGAAAVQEGKGETKPGYASPMLATLHGGLQILNFDGTALRGHDPESGAELWNFPYKAGDYISVAQPIPFDDGRVFISGNYGAGSRMVQVSREGETWSAKQLWKTTQLQCKFSSAILFDGAIYGLDQGIMVCLDPGTGKRLWKGGRGGLRGRYGHGQMLLSNGQIIVLTEGGEAVLIEPSPEALNEVTRTRVLPEGKSWNPPALVRGKLFVRSAREMACFNLAR